MVSVFVEARNSFRCEPPAKSEYEVVVGQLSLDLSVGDGDDPVERIDVRDFGFDEVNFPIRHRLTQVERNIRCLAFTKCEADECWVEDKLATARDECDLMLVAELFSESLGRCNAAESTTEDQDLRHDVRLCMICTNRGDQVLVGYLAGEAARYFAAQRNFPHGGLHKSTG